MTIDASWGLASDKEIHQEKGTNVTPSRHKEGQSERTRKKNKDKKQKHDPDVGVNTEQIRD